MQQFTRKKKYKAKDPEETLGIIKNIMSECGIKVAEKCRYADVPDVASCRIWITGGDIEFGDFGTNGKGMTEGYSLASAYSEFMERLQNMALFGDYIEDAYHKGLVRYMVSPDEVMLSAEECLDRAEDILGKLLRFSDADVFPETEKMAAVPYHDVFNDREVFLPHKTLRMCIGTNGMCAGNNRMEAVTQGLAEIYERAAVREAYEKDPVIRQLHMESFKGNAVYDRLKRLENRGYGVKILDLSMGKDYPVTGLLIEKDGAKAFRAGADPCPVTALERCLTEIYQGDEASIRRFFKKECCLPFPEVTDEGMRQFINDEEIAYHVDGSGMAAHCIFNPSGEFNENFKGTEGESEEKDYEYMISLTKKLSLGLLIRDWSFLGFPAFQCVIPELSNYDLIFEDGAEIYNWSFEKTVFRNDRFTKEIARIAGRLFEIYEKYLG